MSPYISYLTACIIESDSFPVFPWEIRGTRKNDSFSLPRSRRPIRCVLRLTRFHLFREIRRKRRLRTSQSYSYDVQHERRVRDVEAQPLEATLASWVLFKLPKCIITQYAQLRTWINRFIALAMEIIFSGEAKSTLLTPEERSTPFI